MKKVMEAFLVSGSKGNEGDGTKSSEAYTSRNKDNHKDTSGEALCSTLDLHLRKKNKESYPKKEERAVLWKTSQGYSKVKV